MSLKTPETLNDAENSRGYNYVSILYIYIFNSNYVLTVTASSRIKNFSCVSGIILHITIGFSAPNPSVILDSLSVNVVIFAGPLLWIVRNST